MNPHVLFTQRQSSSTSVDETGPLWKPDFVLIHTIEEEGEILASENNVERSGRLVLVGGSVMPPLTAVEIALTIATFLLATKVTSREATRWV